MPSAQSFGSDPCFAPPSDAGRTDGASCSRFGAYGYVRCPYLVDGDFNADVEDRVFREVVFPYFREPGLSPFCADGVRGSYATGGYGKLLTISWSVRC